MQNAGPSIAAVPRGRPLAGDAGSSRALSAGRADARTQADLARLKETTGKVVGSVFYATMLKTMRENSMKGRYGHGGRGEEIFAAQLHGVLAERAGTRSGDSISEELFRRLERQQTLISRTVTEREPIPGRASDTKPAFPGADPTGSRRPQ